MSIADTRHRDWRSLMNRRRRRVDWPNGAVAAVTVGIALEAFERQSQLRLAGTAGERDAFSLSYGEYGVRVGVWRLLRLLDEMRVKASFSVSGKLAEEWPEVVAAVHDAGHELVGHGWVNDQPLNAADGEDGLRIITRTLDAIEEAAGERPVGWASPANSSSDRARQAMAQAGVMWCGDDASDDLPFVATPNGDSLVILPKANLACNDLVHWVMPTNSPAVFREGFEDSLQIAVEEGNAGYPQWVDMVLHCHMAGRPAFIPTLRACLEQARSQGRLWWTTKGELARRTMHQDATR